MNMFVKEILIFLISSPLFVDAIFGGEYVTNSHEYPWMVNIQSLELETIRSSENFPKSVKIVKVKSCGGAIISENIILTAAHCVDDGWAKYSRNSEFKKTVILVRIGNPSLNQSIKVRVESLLIHPKYSNNSILPDRDIALLKLSQDLKFNEEIQPIALPDEDFNETNYLDKSKSKFMVAGWGVAFDIPKDFYPLIKSGKWTWHRSKIPKEKYLKFCDGNNIKCEDNIKLMIPKTLKVTEVNYVKDGSVSIWNVKTPFLINAISTKPYIPGICRGDSGGPLMKLDVTSGKYEVVGVVSRRWKPPMGPRGCLGPMPGIYTRVSTSLQWIKESMTKSSNPDLFMHLYQFRKVSQGFKEDQIVRTGLNGCAWLVQLSKYQENGDMFCCANCK